MTIGGEDESTCGGKFSVSNIDEMVKLVVRILRESATHTMGTAEIGSKVEEMTGHAYKKRYKPKYGKLRYGNS